MRRFTNVVLGLLALAGCGEDRAAGSESDRLGRVGADAGNDADLEPVADAGLDAQLDDAGSGSQDGPVPIVVVEVAEPTPSPRPERLRVVNWNIKAGRDSSIRAIAGRLQALEPDVIVLQELDVKTSRTGQIDQPALLAEALGFNYAFAETIPWLGGVYGIATLSRYPFTGLRRIPLSNQGVEEIRTALESTICVRSSCLRLINHHADERRGAAATSTKEIVDDVAGELGTGLALLADLNQTPTDVGPTYCVAAGFVDVGQQFGGAATAGTRRIDYAFFDSALAPCVEQLSVEHVDEADHYPMVIDLDLECLQTQLAR